MEDKLEGLCKWLKETKGITEIDVLEFSEYLPEYEEYLEKEDDKFLLDEKGFVFIDNQFRPFWVAMRYGKPMLAYWHEAQKSWVNLREVSQIEIWQMGEHKISNEHTKIYHDMHKKFINE